VNEYIEKLLENADYQTFLKNWYEFVQLVNKFVQDTESWKLIKQDKSK
jgi:methionyl-tRNA synthetase